ncbi:MAG TPA: 5-formyltetrahydrofolate cyclo-ligase [Cytophagaceae bacterium]|jgi:5-formyltetrahydrofolate cyclo-ligase|nr:5-formyltetrahydrofolate cyclo-ligase [Cytophagaceae bacterium]
MKTKKEWRSYYQNLRHALTGMEREHQSSRIADHYLQLFQKERPQVVHLFLPMSSKAEVNTFFILKRLNEEYPKVKTVTSVVAEDQHTLLTVEVRIDTPLSTNHWGISEPESRVLFPEVDIEEVLTPLLAMDERGYRLGYGKGFYDRFFSVCSDSVKRTGLNYFPVAEAELPTDEWDVTLHRLVSVEGVFVVDGQ